jgi:chemotaxis protein CheC
MNLVINDLEKDIIREIINIGVARAADSFAGIAKERVVLNAPDLRIIDAEAIAGFFTSYEKHNVIIQSDITGDLDGKTFLLFTESQSEVLAQICLGNVKTDGLEHEYLKSSLLLEVGNIITGALVTQLANILQLKVFGSVPERKNNYIGNVLKNLSVQYPLFKPFIFTIQTHFVYSWKTFEVPLIMVFDLNALYKILAIIRSKNLDKFEMLKSK